MDYTVQGIFQARVLEWVAYPFSSGSSRLRNWTGVSCIAGGFFTNQAVSEWSLCFPQSCGSFVMKSHWPSKSDPLGIPSPFTGSPDWEPCWGAQNLHNSGRRLVLLSSSLWVIHLAGAVILKISFVFFWVEGGSTCPGSHDFLFFGLFPCFLKAHHHGELCDKAIKGMIPTAPVWTGCPLWSSSIVILQEILLAFGWISCFLCPS